MKTRMEKYKERREALKENSRIIEEVAAMNEPAMVNESEDMYQCPNCGQILSMKYKGLCIECIKGIHYCPNCGQALDWSEV